MTSSPRPARKIRLRFMVVMGFRVENDVKAELRERGHPVPVSEGVAQIYLVEEERHAKFLVRFLNFNRVKRSQYTVYFPVLLPVPYQPNARLVKLYEYEGLGGPERTLVFKSYVLSVFPGESPENMRMLAHSWEISKPGATRQGVIEPRPTKPRSGQASGPEEVPF